MNLLATLAHVLRCDVDDLPTDQPWNEARETQMSHAAETWDDETKTSQPLLPRIAYPDLYAEPDEESHDQPA